MLELLGIIDGLRIQQHFNSTFQHNYPYQAAHNSINPKSTIANLTMDIQNLDLKSTLMATEIPDSVTDATQQIKADSPNFNYSGRIDWQNQVPAFSFPGTVVKFKFKGTSLKLELSEDNWNDGNYLDVYLDDNPKPIHIQLKTGKQPIIYQIAEGLENKVHNVAIVKRNDYIPGEFKFHSIIIDGQLLPPDPQSQRRIEVYGDSISAASVVEYPVTGVADPEDKNSQEALSNAYYSYAAILARDYQAELSLVAQAGASLVDGYGYWDHETGLEAFYDKVKPLKNAPQWDFSQYTPDLVIIALGQNDSSTIQIDQDMSAETWKQHYKQLIANLRTQYPNAYFVGMFPNMYHDREWDNYLTEAIAEYRQQYNDNRVFSLIQPQVTPGHPRISEQQMMADSLKDFIEGTLKKNGFSWDVAN